MNPTIRKYYLQFGALALILVFATAQYFLLLRHKSPYLSDSFFYKHIYYQLKGDSFNEARDKIQSQFDFENADKITRNIFENKIAYENSYTFYTKRPLYPFAAYLLSFIISKEFIIFLIPVFLSYLGVIILAYYFAKVALGSLFAVLTTALFIAFYPFLDWSTYLLTDTIGAFFWLLQLFFIYKFFTEGKNNWLANYAFTLSLSLLNREQSILMLPLLIIVLVSARFYKFKPLLRKQIKSTVLVTFIITAVYLMISSVFGQRTILDTIVYTQNNYGLTADTYSLAESLVWVKNQIVLAHVAFIKDLVRHHWWFTLTLLAFLGIVKTVFFTKEKRIIDLLLVSSAIASYLAIFIYPVLSYRFFFPVLLTIVFFSMKFTKEYFEN